MKRTELNWLNSIGSVNVMMWTIYFYIYYIITSVVHWRMRECEVNNKAIYWYYIYIYETVWKGKKWQHVINNAFIYNIYYLGLVLLHLLMLLFFCGRIVKEPSIFNRTWVEYALTHTHNLVNIGTFQVSLQCIT